MENSWMGKSIGIFEFDNMVVFKDLKDLFEYCKSCQADPSLYSSFNVEVKEERKKKNIEQIEDWEDDNYWESLFLSEPEYVKHSNITEEEWLSMAAFNDYEEDDFEKTYNEKDLTEEELEKIDFEVNFVEEPSEEEKYEAVSDKEFFDAFGGNPFLDDSSPF